MRRYLLMLLVLTLTPGWADQPQPLTLEQARALCRQYLEDGLFDRQEEARLVELAKTAPQGRVRDFLVLVSQPLPVQPLWTGETADWTRMLSVATLAPVTWERLRGFGARELFEAWSDQRLEDEVDRIRGLLDDADPWTQGYGRLLLVQSLEELQNNVSSRLPEFEGLELTEEYQPPR